MTRFGFGPPVITWALHAGLGAILITGGVYELSIQRLPPIGLTAVTWLQVAVGSISVAVALWPRTRGVDLMPSHALVRGVRRQVIPWQDVRAVVRHNQPEGGSLPAASHAVSRTGAASLTS